MSHIARIVYNENNWVVPSNSDIQGIPVDLKSRTYFYGYEEWLFNPELLKLKVGYIDCYRNILVKKTIKKILLVTKNPLKDYYYHVANLYNVTQLREKDIQNIRESINNEWLKSTENIFNSKPFFDMNSIFDHQYLVSWNSDEIISSISLSFIVNLRYENIELLNKPINLTLLDKKINEKKIHRLSDLYICENIIESDFNSKLKEYLKDQLL